MHRLQRVLAFLVILCCAGTGSSTCHQASTLQLGLPHTPSIPQQRNLSMIPDPWKFRRFCTINFPIQVFDNCRCYPRYLPLLALYGAWYIPWMAIVLPVHLPFWSLRRHCQPKFLGTSSLPWWAVPMSTHWILSYRTGEVYAAFGQSWCSELGFHVFWYRRGSGTDFHWSAVFRTSCIWCTANAHRCISIPKWDGRPNIFCFARGTCVSICTHRKCERYMMMSVRWWRWEAKQGFWQIFKEKVLAVVGGEL